MTDMNAPADGKSLRVAIAPFGTEGDVRPFLWMADQLTRAGHRAVFIASPNHARMIEEAGYACRCVGDAEAMRRFLGDPRLWDGLKGSRLVLQALLDNLRPFAAPIIEPAFEADLLVGSSLAISAAIAAEARGLPFVRVHLQPVSFRSATAAPLLAPGLAWLRRMPAPVIRGFFHLLDVSLDGAPLREINRFRQELGLLRWRSFYKDAFCGTGPTCCLFPEWFGEPQADWPVTVRCFDFPLRRGGAARPLSSGLLRFLDAASPPVLWTHGSGNLHTEAFARAARQCCSELGLRGILVAPGAQPDRSAGDTAFLSLDYAPFESLMPRCRAVVHHGGIGTLAEALKAGLPQLIVPRAHDQFDNAARAERLGFGLSLDYRRLAQASDRLRTLLASERPAIRARELGDRIEARTDIVGWLEACARVSISAAAPVT